MSDTYTKLFRSIAASTIVSEPLATRWLWVTMLSQADKAGKVYASVPGLARMANITLAETEAGLQCFLSPDAYSRTADNEGRRIEAIDGGWRLLNHAKYDAMRSEAERREYKRDWDRTHRSKAAKAEADTSGKSDTNPTTSDKSDASDPSSQFSVLSSQVDQKQDQKPERASPNGSRLPIDWVLPDDYRAWCEAKHPEIDPDGEAEKFADHWHAKAGKDARKTDWLATWRNWLRTDFPKAMKARAGPSVQAGPASKTRSAIEKLQALKLPETPHDPDMAAQRTAGRPEQVALLATG